MDAGAKKVEEMYAVIKTGGKQYRVKPDDVVTIERLKGEAGDLIEFAEVLMVAGEEGVSVGAPFVAGATVAAELVAQTRGEKIIIFKKKRRQHYRRRNGHRQDLTEVRITEILTDGRKPEKKAKPAEAPKAAEPEEAPAAAAAAGAPDDLSLISGVGAVIVKKLAAEGVTALSQVAEFTPERIAELDEKLGLRGRIEREEWVEQAKELLAGKPPRAKADRKAAEDKAGEDKQD